MISSTPQLLSRATLRSAATIYFLIALPVIFALVLGLILDRHFALGRWEKRQVESVTALKVQSTSQFYDALSDLLILAENHSLFSGLPTANNELAARFDRLARFRRSFHQLRFIDVTGQELVRVNFRGDAPQRISGEGNEASNSEYINEALTVAAKAETLLSSIRAIAHTSFSNLPIIDLASFLQETIESIRNEWPNEITLSTNLSSEAMQVRCLPELIMTAILALLDNVRDAVGDQGEIEIGLGVFHAINTTCVTCDEPLNSTYVEISISDSGKGVAPNIRNQISDPFFSTKDSSQLVGNTPGLGLSAVRSIMHTHRGHIRLSSNKKGGATFHLLLPMA